MLLVFVARGLQVDLCASMVAGSIWGDIGGCTLTRSLDLTGSEIVNVPEVALKLNNNGTCMYAVLELSDPAVTL